MHRKLGTDRRADAQTASASSYAGLFAVTLATLMLQVLLTRIFSVTLWYHFAFMAISIAMFGLSVGATWVYLRPARFPIERTPESLAGCALAFALSTVICFFVHLQVPYLTGTGSVAPHTPDEAAGSFSSTVAYLGLTYAVIAVPFVFSGATVCLALTRFPLQVGRLYAADLCGAGFGCLLVVALLRATDAPVAVVAVAGIAAAGSWLFAPALDPRPRLVPLLAARGNGARLGGTPPPEAPAPRALPFADMPDVMCGLLMASLAALLSIMSHGQHVQTGVPMTHLYPGIYL